MFPTHSPTMHQLEIEINKNPVQILLKDTPGMHKYKESVDEYVLNASKIMLVFSITNKDSYYMVSERI